MPPEGVGGPYSGQIVSGGFWLDPWNGTSGEMGAGMVH